MPVQQPAAGCAGEGIALRRRDAGLHDATPCDWRDVRRRRQPWPPELTPTSTTSTGRPRAVGELRVGTLTWLARGGVVACEGPYFALASHWLQLWGTRDPLDKLRAIETGAPQRVEGSTYFSPRFGVLRWHGPSLVPRQPGVGLGVGLWRAAGGHPVLPHLPPSLQPANTETCSHGLGTGPASAAPADAPPRVHRDRVTAAHRPSFCVLTSSTDKTTPRPDQVSNGGETGPPLHQ